MSGFVRLLLMNLGPRGGAFDIYYRGGSANFEVVRPGNGCGKGVAFTLYLLIAYTNTNTICSY